MHHLTHQDLERICVTLDLNHFEPLFIILYFGYSKIADLQAHSAAL